MRRPLEAGPLLEGRADASRRMMMPCGADVAEQRQRQRRAQARAAPADAGVRTKPSSATSAAINRPAAGKLRAWVKNTKN